MFNANINLNGSSISESEGWIFRKRVLTSFDLSSFNRRRSRKAYKFWSVKNWRCFCVMQIPHDLVHFPRALFYGFAIDIFVCIVRFILDSFKYYLSSKSLEIFIRRPGLFLLGLFVREEGSLKRGHVPTFDSPSKPESKRWSQESSCNTDTPRARRSIAHAFASSPKLASSIPKSRSPSQRVMEILYLVFLSIFDLLK